MRRRRVIIESADAGGGSGENYLAGVKLPNWVAAGSVGPGWDSALVASARSWTAERYGFEKPAVFSPWRLQRRRRRLALCVVDFLLQE